MDVGYFFQETSSPARATEWFTAVRQMAAPVRLTADDRRRDYNKQMNVRQMVARKTPVPYLRWGRRKCRNLACKTLLFTDKKQ